MGSGVRAGSADPLLSGAWPQSSSDLRDRSSEGQESISSASYSLCFFKVSDTGCAIDLDLLHPLIPLSYEAARHLKIGSDRLSTDTDMRVYVLPSRIKESRQEQYDPSISSCREVSTKRLQWNRFV